MEKIGWTFKNIGRTIEVRTGIHGEKCGKDTWYGWKTPGSTGIASVSVMFFNSGIATLEFQNCHIMGTVDVLLSHKLNTTERKIANAKGGDKSSQVKFYFYKGTTLNITTKGGIVKLNSLAISCNGNYKIKI